MKRTVLISAAVGCAAAIPACAAAGAEASPQAPTPRCTTAQLRPTLFDNVATKGVRHATLKLRNASRTACVLEGFPRVQLQYNDKALSTKIVHATGVMTHPVTLGYGASAQSKWSWSSRTAGCKNPEVAFITAPGTSEALRIYWSGGAICGNITATPFAKAGSSFLRAGLSTPSSVGFSPKRIPPPQS